MKNTLHFCKLLTMNIMSASDSIQNFGKEILKLKKICYFENIFKQDF